MTATCAFLSFRLGLDDGVSIVAETWRRCFEGLGWRTVTVAGAGPVDHRIAGLEIESSGPVDTAALAAALADVDLVVVENLLSIPLNLDASRAVAAELAGRPALLHHHDPPWQRERFAHITELPATDPAWRHVTINDFTRAEFAERGIRATTIYNGFDTTVEAGDRTPIRDRLGLGDVDILAVHPVRAIARKNIPAAVSLAEALGAVYWLPGVAEEGYGPELEAILAQAGCRVLRDPLGSLGPEVTMADLYAAADLVLFPSLWEGFGNPPVEAAIHRRPVAVGRYRAADELRRLGFRWLDAHDPVAVGACLRQDPTEDLDHNRALVERHLSTEVMGRRVKGLLDEAGWSP